MNGKTISHYRILGQIGEGGMGVVYVAEDTRLGRRVAIKIPHAGKDESHYRARFLREARAVSKLNHRNIAAVYDLGETDDGQLYIVMELVSGQTLGDVLAGDGLSVARAVEVIREVADALSEAHSHGIIHRDVKPSNVIISERGEVKVLDFGLAKQLDEDGTKSRALSEHTRSDVVIGTPLYLSPEQARGAKVDRRSDLFALGALLYECVSGRPAFSGANVIEIGAQVLHFDPPPPSRFNPRVTTEVDRLVKRALAKKPEDRFQTAKEFSDELTRLRARIPDSDSTRTRRLAGVESLARSSAFITMAETLRRPRFSPLTVIGAVAALALVALVLYFTLRPTVHTPKPEVVALYEQGVEAMREGGYLRATDLLKKAVAADAEYVLAHARLAEAWTELEYLDRAKDEMLLATTLPDKGALTREDALYFDAVSATVTRKYPEAVKNYEELVRLRANPQRLVDLGRAYVKNDEAPKAVEAFMKAAGGDESYATAWVNLGTQHARTKNLAAAATAFDRAVKLYVKAGNREGESEVHYQRGRLLVEQGKKAEARGELEQALSVARSTGNIYQQVQALLQLAYVPDDLEQAKTYATDAVNLAQTNNMQNLAARGYIDLGAQYLGRSLYDEADRFLTRGLEFARDYKVRRLEAVAKINLASVRVGQNRFAEAASFAEQARDYYAQNGFRRELATASLLLARIKGRQGDYEGARAAFEELIRANESSTDARLLGMLHRECGSVLEKQERFAESIDHYRKAISIAKDVPDNKLLAYSLLNIAGSLWRLGRYDEAGEALKQLAEMVASQNSDKDMLTFASLVEANMALSQGRFGDARAKGGQVLADMKAVGSRRETTADADVVVCLAETFGGTPARGKPMCDEAALLAAQIGDPLFVSNSQLALAEALLEVGDAVGARTQALAAEDFFARSGRVESDWRALVIAGKACRLAGDGAAARDCFARAAAQLSLLEKSMGEAAAGYLSRQDVQRLRRELGGDAVAEAR
jgi:tetratricopeptide (TPR) repeat protein